MSVSANKRLFGQIRCNQQWKKKDTGAVMTVLSRQSNNSWRVTFNTKSIKSSHKLKERAIYKFYEKIS